MITDKTISRLHHPIFSCSVLTHTNAVTYATTAGFPLDRLDIVNSCTKLYKTVPYSVYTNYNINIPPWPNMQIYVLLHIFPRCVIHKYICVTYNYYYILLTILQLLFKTPYRSKYFNRYVRNKSFAVGDKFFPLI